MTYFDQINVFLYLTIGMIAALVKSPESEVAESEVAEFELDNNQDIIQFPPQVRS